METAQNDIEGVGEGNFAHKVQGAQIMGVQANVRNALDWAVVQESTRQLRRIFSEELLKLIEQRQELRLNNQDGETIVITEMNVPNVQRPYVVYGETKHGTCTMFFSENGDISISYHCPSERQIEYVHVTPDRDPELYALLLACRKAGQSIFPDIAADDADGDFEPEMELQKIKALPKMQRTEAIRAFRQRQETQTCFLSELPDKVRNYLGNHPNPDPLEVYEAVVGEGVNHLSKKQQKEVLLRINQYLSMRLAARLYFEKYKNDPKALLALITGLEGDALSGNITMERLRGALVFDIESEEAFYAVRHGRSESHSQEGNYPIIACLLEHSEIYQLKHAVVVGRELTQNDEKDAILDHELRHQENKVLLPSRELKARRKSFSPRVYLKDEILSYLKDGRADAEGLKEVLGSPDGTYNFIQKHREALKGLIESTDDTGERADGESRLEEFNRKWTSECEKAYFEDLKKYIDIAFAIGSAGIEGLTITPIRKWYKLLEPKSDQVLVEKPKTTFWIRMKRLLPW
ncbi:MAG: hypothetical protein ACI9QC_000825 [Oceanicoccus sp.]|jgi:hypothetical protein